MMSIKELEQRYNDLSLRWKIKIRLETNKFKRLFKWIWYFICFPWIWLFYNIQDWRSLICILISLLLWSGSVWIWYLLYFLTNNNWFIAIGSSIWIWWISPVGSPFILLVTITSIGIKSIYNLLIRRKKK